MDPELIRVEQLYRSPGRMIRATQTICALAGVATAEGRFEDASENARRGLKKSLAMNDIYLQVWGIEWLAMAEAELGNARLAATLTGAAEAAHDRLGGSWSPDLLDLDDPRTRLVRVLGEEDAEKAIAPGRELSVEAAVSLALNPEVG